MFVGSLFGFYHVDVDYVVVVGRTALDTRLGFWFEGEEGVGGVEVEGESIHALLPHIVSMEMDLDNVMDGHELEWN